MLRLKSVHVWLVCDGIMIRSNPIVDVLCTMSIVTWELWPSKICKCQLNVHNLP
jgi:hypothetical protein